MSRRLGEYTQVTHSERMIRRGDAIAASGRWLALIPVVLVALLGPSSDLRSGRWSVLNVAFVMVAIDAIPVVMLTLRVYPDWAARVFVLLDSLFCISVLYLGGPRMFFYCFVPVLTTSVRFHWTAGLANALVLIVGHVLILSLRAGPLLADVLRSTHPIGAAVVAGWASVRQAFVLTLSQIVSLLLASLFGGLLIESIKREPPLNAEEVRAREQEMSYWRAAADRARAINSMAGALSATLDSDEILDAVLEISAAGFDEISEERSPLGGRLASAILLFGQEGLYVAASRGLGHDEVDLTLPGERGVLSEALRSDEPKVWGTLADDPELQAFATFRRCQSAIGVPLRASREIYGVVLFANSRPDAFGKEHVEMLGVVSSQAAMALNNAYLYQDLQREKENLLSVEEEARAKLARDLHDGPTQSISAIAMRLNYVRLLLDRDPERVRAELFRLENIARHTTKDIRTLLFTLRPLVLETQGLKAAVEQLVERIFARKATGEEPDEPVVTLEIEDVEGRLDLGTQAVAWFVIEESLNNVRKYANARKVDVKVGIKDGRFVAEICDDGDGFDVEAIMATRDQRMSYGLLGLQERADLVNGQTTIESKPGQGTRITLVVPLSRQVD
jgi:signal transduction histidine kinase